MKMSKICVFFGHRTASSKIVESLKQQIRRLVLEEGIKVFWVGGYGDFDMYAASAVRTIKSELPDEGIELDLIYAYLPSPTAKEQQAYQAKLYDGTIYPEGVEIGPPKFAITRRNRWMVENCDIVLAFINRDSGGAYTAVKVANRKGKRIINLGTLEIK